MVAKVLQCAIIHRLLDTRPDFTVLMLFEFSLSPIPWSFCSSSGFLGCELMEGRTYTDFHPFTTPF